MSKQSTLDRYNPNRGLDKTTSDVLLIVFGLITTMAFGFAVWSAFRTIKMQEEANKQSVQYMKQSILDRRDIEEQTQRVQETVAKVEDAVSRLEQVIASSAQSGRL